MAGTRALNILVVHGIGWGHRGKGYPRPLQDSIGRAFDRTIDRLRLRDVDRRAARARQALRFEVVCWDPVTQKPQDSLLAVMFGGWKPFRRLNLTYVVRRNLVALLGDVTAYERDPNNRVYCAIHETVSESMRALSEASADERGADGCAPLTIIGHSLGSVIASDYVWDHTRSSGHSYRLDEHGFALTNMVQLGSPMAIYALRNNAYGGRESIRESLDSPVRVEPEVGLWLNVYDMHDPIAFPLEPIDSYRAAGVIDCAIRSGTWLTGWNLGSHVGYWVCRDAGDVIGRKLALDWARLNSPRFAEDGFEKAYAAYRKELKKG